MLPAIVSFEIEHEGCWTGLSRNLDLRIRTLGQEFPGSEVFSARIAALGKDLAAFMKSFRGHKQILSSRLRLYERLRSEEGVLRTAVIEFTSQRRGSVSGLVNSAGGLILEQEVREGLEIWTVLLPRYNSDLRELLLETLSSMGGLGMFSEKPFEPRMLITGRALLTPQEEAVLETAIRLGYFENSRIHDAQEIASLLGMKRATFLYHLRKGLGKLAAKYMYTRTRW